MITTNNNNINRSFPIRTAAVRTIKSPVEDTDITRYIALVNLRDVPEGLPTEVNPRETNMRTATARKLLESVESSDPNFDVYNRGMVIIANNVRFDNTQSILTVDFDSDNSRFGVLDGGHTYRAILERRKGIPSDIDKYVMMEILVGKDLSVADISDARNTSVQVSDIALYNLENRLDPIKKAIEKCDFAEKVAYKDNEDKDIPVSDLLKLMFTFNIKKYPDNSNFPISAYSGKAMVFKDYKAEYDEHKNTSQNIYMSLSQLLPELVKLYEAIQVDMPRFYDENHNGRSRFGGIRGIEGRGNYKTDFNSHPAGYKIPTGYLMPVFGAFRALLVNKPSEEEPYQLDWVFSPLDYWQKMGQSLVKTLFNYGTFPNNTGKNTSAWEALYQAVKNQMLDDQKQITEKDKLELKTQNRDLEDQIKKLRARVKELEG